VNDIPFFSIFALNADEPPRLAFSFNILHQAELLSTRRKISCGLFNFFKTHPFVGRSHLGTKEVLGAHFRIIYSSLERFEKCIDSREWIDSEFIHGCAVFKV
jgi:hypothetical protein